MPVTTAVAIFFLIWWVVLFAVLPWGIRGQHEGQDIDEDIDQDIDQDIAPGTDPGAPIAARIGWKLLWTTLIAIAVYAAGYLVYSRHWITIDGLIAPFGK
jgi:predicted secreted protein